MQYLVHRPGPRLGSLVESLWLLTDAPAHGRERIVPSGTVELVFNLHEDEFRIGESAGGKERRYRGAMVSGCYSEAFDIDTRAHNLVLGVHFKPGGAGSVLGVPTSELANEHVGLEDIWGASATELRDRLCVTQSLQHRFEMLEGALVARLPDRQRRRAAVTVGLAHLERPGTEVGHVARELGLSRRRFIEVFTEDVGMTPERYSMVRRFQRALSLASRSPPAPWTQIALECGYFDQAHLCRDWSTLTGMSPGQFLTQRAISVKENHIALREVGVTSVQDTPNSGSRFLPCNEPTRNQS
jgi:AraC-like DNA-binding protein